MAARRGRLAAAVGLVLSVALAGCTPLRSPLWTGTGQKASYGYGFVTRDDGDGIEIQAIDGGVRTVALPTNQGSNTRTVFWPRRSGAVTDAESCATWTESEGELVQRGAALRVTRDGDRLRAVTVTQNIMWGVGEVFNVHTWDTQRAGAPSRMAGQIDLRTTFFAEPRSLPWTVCARVIDDTVAMKIWDSDDQPEPDWGDPMHGGSVTLPPGWRDRGQVGWYIGHLRAGDQAVLTDLSTWTYDPDPSLHGVAATGP